MAILIAASIASWCVIVWRARQAVASKAATRATAETLESSESLSALRAALEEAPEETQGATYRLAADALGVLPFHGSYDPALLARLERRLRRGIEEHLAVYEQGLGLLATTAVVSGTPGA